MDTNVKVHKLSELLEIIRVLTEQYPKNLVVNTKGDNFIFRGVSNKEYSLKPSVYREQPGEEKGEFTPVPVGTTSANIITNRAYLYTDENVLLDDFIREATPLVMTKEMSRLKWMEMAQHYGAPTRLLDWTGNPLVALFFVVSANRKDDGILWMLHKNNYREFLKTKEKYYAGIDKTHDRNIAEGIIGGTPLEQLPMYPFVYSPNYLDERMAAQSSYFMIWGKSRNSFEKLVSDSNYMKYDSEYFNRGPVVQIKDELNQFLMAITIEAKYKISMLDELRVLGIHEKSIFPGLDGVGKYVERYHRNDLRYTKLMFGEYNIDDNN